MKKVFLGLLGLAVAAIGIGIVTLFVMGKREDAGRNTARIQIERPPAQVFPWITEPGRLQQWIGGLVESAPLTDEGLKVGARSREVVVVGNGRYEMETTVVDLEAPARLVVEINAEGFKVDARYDLVESGGGTFLSYACIARYEHPLAKLMEPLVTREAQKKLAADLARLKELVEAEPWSGAR
jgi:carbon monoxide dehydrogenase subunit G